MSITDTPLDRRGFLRGSVALTAAVALPGWLLAACGGQGSAAVVESGAGVTTFKATHGAGLCNMAWFLAKEKGYSKSMELEWVVAPTGADVVTLFGTGEVNVSVVPYTFFMTLKDKGAPLKIISGAGIQGCTLVARKGIKSAEDLRGKTIGTFQADTLELLVYGYLKAAGMTFKDVKMKYFGTSPELTQAFMSGDIDAATQTEPFASQLAANLGGSSKLTNGIDIYGKGYTDCVLAASEDSITKHRAGYKELVRAMLMGQGLVETNPKEAVALTATKYFKNTDDVVLKAVEAQPAMVDQRVNSKFVMERSQDVHDMGYISKPQGDEIFDWSILTEVIKENPDVYQSLKWKSA